MSRSSSAIAPVCDPHAGTVSGLPRPESARSTREAGDGEHLGIVCGPAAVPGQRRANKASREGDVSRRMSDILSMCRSRLATTRRHAKDAEQKMKTAEDDLLRIGEDM